MCSIIAGSDAEEVKRLVTLNKVRGTHSHSIFYVNIEDLELTHSEKNLGELYTDDIRIPKNHFCIIHQQAPTTTAKSIDSIHPSKIEDIDGVSYLWHNGIIKDAQCQALREMYDVDDVWDTKLIHYVLNETGNMNNIDGTFACVEYRVGEHINIFRNEIAPLYTDFKSISSMQFPGSRLIEPNRIHDVALYKSGSETTISFYPYKEFKTVENPYYFGDD